MFDEYKKYDKNNSYHYLQSTPNLGGYEKSCNTHYWVNIVQK